MKIRCEKINTPRPMDEILTQMLLCHQLLHMDDTLTPKLLCFDDISLQTAKFPFPYIIGLIERKKEKEKKN
jgi:hypothetical protein